MSILWPMDYVEVTGQFGNSPDFYAQFGQRGHNGIDLGTKHAIGMPVYSTDAGTVVYEGWGSGDNWMGTIAGICVRIKHWWGYSAYAHLSSTIVNAGQWVARGQKIGLSGATGVGTGPHLHFETYPLYPNFGNGYAGRVNPHVWGVVPRGSNPAPAPKPIPEVNKEIPVDYITGYNSKSNNKKRQELKAGGASKWLHTNSSEHTAISTGKGKYIITTTVDVSGTPGDRIVLNSYRVDYVNKKDVKTVFLEEIDALILPNGRVRLQLTIDNVLHKDTERIRVQIRTEPGAGKLTVNRYSWKGFKWAL